MSSRGAEVLFLAIIGGVMLFGGPALLAELARFRGPASLALGLVGIALLFEMRRSLALGGPTARLRVSRDVAFVTALLAAIAFVLFPARWSIGTSIAAFEFGIVLELFGRLVPAPPPAA